MCGLAGFVDPTKDASVLERMTASIARRGPDDFGLYLEDGVGLGHRRLSIIDLSPAGHQPMRFENLMTVYNGEIYNYREIAQELIARGYSFESSSDTEVVLKAFHCWGPQCVERFIGMFAIAIYDLAAKTMYLIRDRAGVKPLYYYFREGRLGFGSELKCFKPYLSRAERSSIDRAALSDFFSFGYVSGESSIIEHVRKVPPAHYLIFRHGKMEAHRYWDVSFAENRAWMRRSEDDLLDELDALVISASKYRMVADVPVGVFLSAGVDSSLVTAVLTRHYGQLKTFTIGFEEAGFDESADARKIANHLGTDHVESVLTSAKAYEILGHFYDIYDEPHGDHSCIPTTYVSELARDAGVKVVLSADAGDELFGGYARYLDFTRRWSQVRRLGGPGRKAAAAMMRALSALSGPDAALKLNRYRELFGNSNFVSFYQNMMLPAASADLAAIFPDYRSPLTRGPEGEALNRMCEWDFKKYMVDDILVKVDRATMYHSIEGREPLLDHRLVEFAAQLPLTYKIRGGETKYLLKRLLGRYLPESLYRLPKRGFGAPLHTWIRDFYGDSFAQVVENGKGGLFDPAGVRPLLDRYRRGKPINYTLLWYLFSFQSWYDKWMSDDEAYQGIVRTGRGRNGPGVAVPVRGGAVAA
jgi:asparagine synthase (glutamine-hydrolysing)